MASSRLTEPQKEELVARYCQGESSLALAEAYGVSTNTISRVVRAALPPDRYEALKQQRARGMAFSPGALVDTTALVGVSETAEASQETVASETTEASQEAEAGETAGTSQEAVASDVHGASDDHDASDDGAREEAGLAVASPSDPVTPAAEVPAAESPAEIAKTMVGKMSRRRSSAGDPPTPVAPEPIEPIVLASPNAAEPGDGDRDEDPDESEHTVLAIDDADDFGDDQGDEDFEDDGGGDGVDLQSFVPIAVSLTPVDGGQAVACRPLTAASFNGGVYMLVDKTVELQPKPLREFSELGALPADEADRQAIAVFINPREAKRQCGRSQRVIKMPDPRLLERTAPYLLAQGISRVVVEGALYALPGS
jgi:hypothetical protein